MRRLVIALSLLIGLTPALADGMAVPLTIPQNSPGAAMSFPPQPAAGYTGPGDVVAAAIAWWGARCYTAAYSGLVADITDAATGNTTGTRLQCSSGTVSALVSASACTFVTGNACSALATTCLVSCNVVTLYDQSGNTNCSAAACNITQATNANRPIFTQSCNGALPCIKFVNASNTTLTSGSLTSTATPITFSLVSSFSTAVGFAAVMGGFGNPPFFGLSNDNTPEIQIFTQGSALTLTSSIVTGLPPQAVQAVFNGASSNLVVNATSNSGSLNTGNNLSGPLTIGADGFGDAYTGDFFEGGIWGIAFNSTQQSNMCHNQFSYWGTAVSC